MEIKKTVEKRSKRLGRGYGSGKGGHTSSRGQKGQKSRGSLGVIFEGVKTKKSFYKRLPLIRGKGKLKALAKPSIISLSDLSVFRAGTVVNLEKLIEEGIVDKKYATKHGVKILGNGEIDKKLTIEVPLSASAKEKIEKAGGKTIIKENKESRN